MTTPTTAGGAVLPVVGYITQDCDFRLSALWSHDQHGALTLHDPAQAEIDALRAELAALKAAQDDQARDAGRWKFLAAEAYECVIPHGNKLGGKRTAWITKLHPGASFESAIDAAIAATKETP